MRTPTTFENDSVSEEACSVVAQFLEHALVVVDRLYDEIVPPKMIIRSMALTSIAEDKEGDGEGKKDDDDEEKQNDATDPTGGLGQIPAPPGPRGSARPSTRTNAGKTKKDSGPNTNECSFEDADKENMLLPFTALNVNKLPTQSVRVFY